jgi:hypothetical protein
MLFQLRKQALGEWDNRRLLKQGSHLVKELRPENVGLIKGPF